MNVTPSVLSCNYTLVTEWRLRRKYFWTIVCGKRPEKLMRWFGGCMSAYSGFDPDKAYYDENEGKVKIHQAIDTFRKPLTIDTYITHRAGMDRLKG